MRRKPELPDLQSQPIPGDANFIEFVRWSRELRKKQKRRRLDVSKPGLQPDALFEAWLSLRIRLHLNLRIRPGLFDLDKCDFCVDLQVV